MSIRLQEGKKKEKGKKEKEEVTAHEKDKESKEMRAGGIKGGKKEEVQKP